MEIDGGILHKIKSLLSSIVLGDDIQVKEGWRKLQQLEENVEVYENSYDYLGILRNLQRELLQGQVKNINEIPRLMKWFAKYLKNVPDPNLSDDLADFLRKFKIDDISILESILQVVNENGVFLSGNTNHKKLCWAVVNCLAECHVSCHIDKISEYNSSVDKIQKYLKPLDDKQNLFACLQQLYKIISKSQRDKSPGYALCIVLLLVDRPLIVEGVNLLLSSPYRDQDLVQALTVISKWLITGKFNELLVEWLFHFILGLESKRKFNILKKISEDMLSSKDVALALILPQKSQTLGMLYLHMLQRQNSSSLFHKFIQLIQEKHVFETLMHQKLDYAKECLQKIIDVVQALMLRFPGCEDLYKSVQQSFPIKPREEFVQEILAGPFWSEEKENKFQISCLPERSRIKIVNVESMRSVDSKVGLHNLGNTCYMNSVLQALAMTKQFRHEVLNYKVNDLSGQILLRKLQNLFALLVYSKRTSLSPNEILHVSRPAYFLPGQQQDSSEFLCHLLDVLYEQEKSTIAINGSTETMIDLKSNSDKPMNDIKRWITEEDLTEGAALQRKTQALANFTQGEDLAQTQQLSDSHSDSTDSGIQSVGGEDVANPPSILVHRVFGGESKITYQCAQCNNSSHNTDKFRDLQLCFPEEIQENQEVTVQNLIDYYLMPEKLTGDNKYRCEKCMNLCDAQRLIKILQAPAHLILTLKHFRYDSESRLRAKLRHKVTYDEIVKLRVFDAPVETYRLYAAVVHSGYSMDYGHYFTYACDSKQQWYRFNDSYVSSTTLEDFKRLEPPDTPYILFYEKTTSDSLLDEDKPELSFLSKHIQDIVESDTKSFFNESRFRDDRKRAGFPLNQYDNSDDDNPPPSTCRGSINISSHYS